MKYSYLAPLFTAVSLSLLTSACATKNYEAVGSYTDTSGMQKNVYLQYVSRHWYIPFVNNDEIGSLAVADNCGPNRLLNGEIDSVHDLIFWEQEQQYVLVDNAPLIRGESFDIACAKLKQGTKLGEAGDGDTLILETYCISKNPRTPIIPASLEGHALVLSVVEKHSCSD